MSVGPLLNAAFEEKLLTTLRKAFGRFLRPGERFVVHSHEAAKDAWLLAVTFENRDQTLHLPLETVLVAADNDGLTTDEARDVLVDFAGYFFGKYFEGDRQVTLPLDWQSMPFGEYTVRARGWERNLKLELAADRLLAGENVEDLL